ncbi:response regulator [uncultured Jatrophihabitans sp.]|uniref:response regulator transcription factor n=1 Tax=uncultured Jatrophihabitans sp. TaxID=1610747 RepID=UPI0035CA7230
MRVVIAEDNYLVREGTRQLLDATGDVEVVAAVGTAPELLDAVRRLSPDAVLTDIRMPPTLRTEGIEAAHAVRREWPAIGVVVLSQHAEGSYALALLAHGSAGLGYLLKDRVGDHHELLHALRQTAAGGSVIDPVIVDALVRQRARATSPLDRLTDRERDVLRLMAQGLTNPAIGSALHLSASAIEKHVAAVFGKLDLPPETPVHRRVAAVLTFLRAQEDSDSA